MPKQFAYSVQKALRIWKPLPKKYLKLYISKFGYPNEMSKDSATWNNMGGFVNTVIKNEEVGHVYPVKHIDFIYSMRKIKAKPEHTCICAKATGSIIVDQLKGEVVARCHYLIKNAVTLGFVEDVVAGKITARNAKKEYGRRILLNQTPKWFKDPLKEYDETLFKGEHHLITTGSNNHRELFKYPEILFRN